MQAENESDPFRATKFVRSPRTWKRKFQDAFQGLYQSVQQQSSYKVHFFFAFLVVFTGFLLNLDPVRWSLLVFCIIIVLAGEMLNTSIETLARAITEEYDENIARALNIASGAILVLSLGAATIGFVVFIEAFLRFF
ncbi:MAG: diacylglycerol kinase family protein [Planctomycetaceae bacterium]|nr:diacylglycerol kinase family protein [Planctomycetaceae bacterium]